VDAAHLKSLPVLLKELLMDEILLSLIIYFINLYFLICENWDQTYVALDEIT
jgi:hypothetical protein